MQLYKVIICNENIMRRNSVTSESFIGARVAEKIRLISHFNTAFAVHTLIYAFKTK